MFKDFFHKKKKYATIPSEKSKRDIPEGIMTKCPECGSIHPSKDLQKNLKVCSNCDHHFRLTAKERIEMILDDGLTVEYDREMVSVDPIQFPSYTEKIEQQKATSEMNDAVITGEGRIGGCEVIVAAMSFSFFAGSMGSVVGEKVTRAIEAADRKQCPLIIFSTSGGARMQESILSLMQMAKTSAALTKLDKNKGLFISIITDPTLGGVPASFAMLGDYILAEPGTSFGFTGRRVIEQTIRQKLPDNFQTAEFNLRHSHLDKVVHREQLKQTLVRLLNMHQFGEGSGDGR